VPRPLKRLLLRFEVAIEEELERFAAELPAGTRLLDAGAGECQYEHLFRHCRYVAVDLGVGDTAWDYSQLDALGDLTALPLRDGACEAALNVVVLEHTREPARVLAEIGRVLRPGGRLLLVAPQEWAVHQVPHDYFRYTRFGLQYLLEQAGFEQIEIRPGGGFFTLLGRRLLDAALFFQGGWRWLLLPPAALLLGPAGVLVPWLDVLDRERLTTLGYFCRATRGASGPRRTP
jgi:SAM-dependent methyltransferase